MSSYEPLWPHHVPPLRCLGSLVLLAYDEVVPLTAGGVHLPEKTVERMKGKRVFDPEAEGLPEIPEFEVMRIIDRGPGTLVIDQESGQERRMPFPDGVEVGAQVVVKPNTYRFRHRGDVYCLTPQDGIIGVWRKPDEVEKERARIRATADLRAAARDEAQAAGRVILA